MSKNWQFPFLPQLLPHKRHELSNMAPKSIGPGKNPRDRCNMNWKPRAYALWLYGTHLKYQECIEVRDVYGYLWSEYVVKVVASIMANHDSKMNKSFDCWLRIPAAPPPSPHPTSYLTTQMWLTAYYHRTNSRYKKLSMTTITETIQKWQSSSGEWYVRT